MLEEVVSMEVINSGIVMDNGAVECISGSGTVRSGRY